MFCHVFRTVHHPLSKAPSGSCPGAAESIWTTGCTQRRTLAKHTGDTHTHTNRYTQTHTQKGNSKIQNCHSLKCAFVTGADSSLPNGKNLKRSLSSTKTESTNQDGAPPEYLLPGSSERPIMALLPHSSQPEVSKYL